MIDNMNIQKEIDDLMSEDVMLKADEVKEFFISELGEFEVNPLSYLFLAKEMKINEIPKFAIISSVDKFIGLTLITNESIIFSGEIAIGEELITSEKEKIKRALIRIPHISISEISAYKVKENEDYVIFKVSFYNEKVDSENSGVKIPMFELEHEKIEIVSLAFEVEDVAEYIFNQQNLLFNEKRY